MNGEVFQMNKKEKSMDFVIWREVLMTMANCIKVVLRFGKRIFFQKKIG